MAPQNSSPTFIVRLVAPGVSPSKIPFRVVNATLSAVQDLASGRDPLETQKVPEDKVIGLVNVRKGSAMYGCIARSPDDARANLRLVGKILSNNFGGDHPDEHLAKTLKPIEKLSEVAKSFGGRVEVALSSQPKDPLFTVARDDFDKLSARLFLEGETTVIGKVVRAGGFTDMKCALSVPGRHKLLFCDVRTKAVVQRLGQCLYSDIAAKGSVVWIHSSWHIYKFTINDFTQPRISNASKAIDRLRKSGLNAWDEVSNPGAYLEDLRQ